MANDCYKASDLYPNCEIPEEVNEKYTQFGWSVSRQNDTTDGPKRLNKADVVYIETCPTPLSGQQQTRPARLCHLLAV
ncbi:hypothetical protein [Zooshikella ganghwensis]|uniref:Uncharacterized protein n=1 Tax=Zooshikella ganghwensis TaxID=202772 RepID=A0A4V1IP69_9GAMM|nr:hypothetical protein [Zooshikella ganghwensis]RDH46191.1 hypothetical protein B9G39_23585 [Zooshikella ganghwensis]